MTDFDERLKCGVIKLKYDFDVSHGDIYLPERHRCDMKGCIDLFKSIDEDVITISVYHVDILESLFRLVNGKWEVRKPRG